MQCEGWFNADYEIKSLILITIKKTYSDVKAAVLWLFIRSEQSEQYTSECKYIYNKQNAV